MIKKLFVQIAHGSQHHIEWNRVKDGGAPRCAYFRHSLDQRKKYI